MTGWEQAYERAGALAAAGQPAGEDIWEYVATRGAIAITLQALGLAGGGPKEVPTGVLLWHLEEHHLRELAVWVVGDELAWATDTDPATVDTSDPVIAAWLWLTRTWPEPEGKGPIRRRWDGMSRGVAPGLPDPAANIIQEWAAYCVRLALGKERSALDVGTRVRVVGGAYIGLAGRVQDLCFEMDDERGDTIPGPPHGYEVLIAVDPPHEFRPTLLSADQVAPDQ
ncbi:hypothetical protein ACIOJD_33960 [Streptomyces sp. NPDC088116]|uniref:hypothetical protein n=1 Tax=Streptomyces sp. NPDC088116 TaxID=3365825 RepID=UPI00382964D1